MLAPKSHPSLKLLFLLAQMIQVTRYTFNAAMKNDLKILIFFIVWHSPNHSSLLLW